MILSREFINIVCLTYKNGYLIFNIEKNQYYSFFVFYYYSNYYFIITDFSHQNGDFVKFHQVI